MKFETCQASGQLYTEASITKPTRKSLILANPSWCGA